MKLENDQTVGKASPYRSSRSASTVGNFSPTGKQKSLRTAPASNDLVWLNVGGQDFLVHRSTLFRVPHSRLYRVACNDFAVATGIISSDGHRLSIDNEILSLMTTCSPQQRTQTQTQTQACNSCDCSCRSRRPAAAGNDETPRVFNAPHLRKPRVCIYFDRDPEIFRYILDYYRNGELHIPHSLCGPNIRKELIFWGVCETEIQVCCLKNYMRYEEESSMKSLLFKDFVEDLAPMKNLVRISCGWRQKRYKMWLFFDYPTSSLPAKCWAFMQLIFIILSILFYCVRTHPHFRTVRQSFHNYSPGDNQASLTLNESTFNMNASFATAYAKSEAAFCQSLKNASQTQRYINLCTEPVSWLRLCDTLLMVHFALDGLFKLLVAPDRMRYCVRVLVLLELVIQITFWTMVSMNLDLHNHDEHYFWPINLINILQALRIARILKVAKLSDGLRVLILTLKRSITELLLLAFLMVNGMFLFACMIYMAEYEITNNFPSIPTAFWWAIITLTGVGYGDVTPNSSMGYMVGGLAAVCGAMVTGLAIPIIGHNFNSYYKYMKNQLKESEYLKQKGEKPGQHNLEVFDKIKLNRVRSISLLQIPSIRVDFDDCSLSKHDTQHAIELPVPQSDASPDSATLLSVRSRPDRLKLDIQNPFNSDGSLISLPKQRTHSASLSSSTDESKAMRERSKSASIASPKERKQEIVSAQDGTTRMDHQQCTTSSPNDRSSPNAICESKNGLVKTQVDCEFDSQQYATSCQSCRHPSMHETAQHLKHSDSVTRTERLIILNPNFQGVNVNRSKLYQLANNSDTLFSSAAVITTPITRID